MRFPTLMLLMLLASTAGAQERKRVLLLGDGPEGWRFHCFLHAGGWDVVRVEDKTTFDGAALAGDLDAVVLLDGYLYQQPMLPEAEAALVAFVQAGGGLVTTDWVTWDIAQGQLLGLVPVIPATYQTYSNAAVGLHAADDEHPVTAGLPASFEVAGYSTTLEPVPGAVTLAADAEGRPLVITAGVGAGQVLHIALPPDDNSRWLANPPMARLFAQAVDFVSGTAAAPDFDPEETGVLCDERPLDRDLVPNGLDNCPERFNPDQSDVDGDGQGDVCDDGEFRVIPVPWVPAAPHVPHDAVDGQWHWFQAVARGPCDATRQFRWDFDGDGTFDQAWTDAPSPYDLGAKHTYPAQATDRLFVARIEARCGDTEEAPVVSGQFPIVVRIAPTRAQRVNRAVSNALWYGHTQMVRDPERRRATWTPDGNPIDSAAFAQALMNRGHRAGVDPDVDPYLRDVQWLLHDLLAAEWLQRHADLAQESGDPDVNGNGFVLRYATSENYQQGPCLEAIASYGDPEYVVPPDVGAGPDVAGRRLGDVVQDAAEYFFWSQTELPMEAGELAGGWGYAPNGGSIDTSQNGWAVLALFAAERNAGTRAPPWLKRRIFNGVRYNDASQGHGEASLGAYGYNACCDWGPFGNMAHSGAMLNALGYALDRNPDDPRVRATVNMIVNLWPSNPGGGWDQHFGSYYSMYQVAKGMRSFAPFFVHIGPDNLDWYAEYVDWLLPTQDENGAWNNDVAQLATRLPLITSLAILILTPTVFEAEPVAVAAADPQLAGPGDLVTFRHGGSYAQDPAVPLARFRWSFFDVPADDRDGDGRVDTGEVTWEFETEDPAATPTHAYRPVGLAFGDVVDYRVVLEVEDRLGRRDTDDESVRVRIALVNHPPVALPHPSGDPEGVYEVVAGRAQHLDGSRSYDPDADDAPQAGFPADRITTFAWDLDNDDTFETEGATPDLRVPDDWAVGEAYVAQLEVCDDGQWVGQRDAQCPDRDCTLCARRSVRLVVVPNRPPVAVLEPTPEVAEDGVLDLDASGSTDPEGGALTYDWACTVGIPLRGRGDGAVLRIDATDLDLSALGVSGSCTLTVTDDLGAAAESQVEVHLRNAPPVVERVDGGGDVEEGTPGRLRVVATDPAPADADALLYSADCDGDGALDVVDAPAGDLECPVLPEGEYATTVVVADDDGGATTVAGPALRVHNGPPVARAFECPPATEGTPIAIQLDVYDPGDDPITCALASPVPGAAIPAGVCAVLWTPTYGQAANGQVDFHVTVSDDAGAAIEVEFACHPTWVDEDDDGLPDSYEREHEIDDPRADPDGDGRTNLEELRAGTDPRVFDGPLAPTLVSPIDDAAVEEARLIAREARGDTMEFAVFEDEAGSVEVARSDAVPIADGEAAWSPPALDDGRYWWTARAHDGLVFGPAAEMESFRLGAVEPDKDAGPDAAADSGVADAQVADAVGADARRADARAPDGGGAIDAAPDARAPEDGAPSPPDFGPAVDADRRGDPRADAGVVHAGDAADGGGTRAGGCDCRAVGPATGPLPLLLLTLLRPRRRR